MITIFKRKRHCNNTSEFISTKERQRLSTFQRYSPFETVLLGKKLYSNDACTLLSDINSILKSRIYEFTTKKENPIIIDCGSNIGISIIFFKEIFNNALVYAFEPDPVLFSLLSKNISSYDYKNVFIQQKAIWSNNHGVFFRLEGGHSGRITDKGDGDADIINVSSLRLKDFLQQFDNVEFLKMDIEGAESEVVLDCDKCLAKCNHVFIEYHSKVNTTQSLHNILNLFYKLGFRYHIKEAFTRKRPFIDRNCMVGMDLQLNLFFWKEF